LIACIAALSLLLILIGLAVPARAQDPAAIAHYRNGDELLKRRNYRAAVVELEAAVAVDSTYGAAAYALGQSYRVLNDFPRAIKTFEAARRLGLFPERIGGELAQLYYRSAVALFQQRQYAESITQLQSSLALESTNAKAHYAMGLAYAGLRDEDQARQAYQKAILADSLDPKPVKALADIQRYRQELGAAAALYQRAIELDSSFLEAYGGLAQVKLETTDLEGTVSLMRQATAIDPQYADGYLFLGIALNQLGRQPQAIEPLHQAVRLAPRNAETHYRLGEAYFGKG
jgi:tetratricopeptide (TPR) repeat protein